VPGEVIYMPHYVEHIVYNPEFTIAVGENLLFPTSMEEAAISLNQEYRRNLIDRWVFLHYSKSFRRSIHHCKFD
jgi:hypothetical protein